MCWPRGGMLSTIQSPPFLALTDTSIPSGQTGSSLILLKIRLLNSSLLFVGLVIGSLLSFSLGAHAPHLSVFSSVRPEVLEAKLGISDWRRPNQDSSALDLLAKR